MPNTVDAWVWQGYNSATGIANDQGVQDETTVPTGFNCPRISTFAVPLALRSGSTIRQLVFPKHQTQAEPCRAGSTNPRWQARFVGVMGDGAKGSGWEAR
jgi:hypothetical protein